MQTHMQYRGVDIVFAVQLHHNSFKICVNVCVYDECLSLVNMATAAVMGVV